MQVYEAQRPQGARALLFTLKAAVIAWLGALSPALARWLAVHVPPVQAPLITDPGFDGTQVVVLPRQAILLAIEEARRLQVPVAPSAACVSPLLREFADLSWWDRRLHRNEGTPCVSIASPPKARKHCEAPWTLPAAAATPS
jgi:hypothetical protein